MKLIISAAIGLAAVVVAPSASAEPVAACPAAPDFSRYDVERQAIEYGRAMGQAVNAREEARGLDRAGDLALLLLPDPASGTDCSGGAPVAASTCHAEDRRAFAAYLTIAIPAEQLRDIWSFLLPRAGLIPSADPAQPLLGWQFTRMLPDGQIGYNDIAAPAYIARRRERAWQYLQNHRNGRAVMSAVSQFIQSRLSDGRGEAAICPVAHAETQRLTGELARP